MHKMVRVLLIMLAFVFPSVSMCKHSLLNNRMLLVY